MVHAVKTVKQVEKYLGYFSKGFSLVAIAAITFNILIIVIDVFSRYVLHSAIMGSNEYVSMAETLVIFFALAYTQHSKGLVHITFFMRKLPKMSPMALWTLHQWCGALVAVLLTYASWMQAQLVDKMHTATQSLLIPYYPFYLLMTIGFAAYTVVQLFDAVKSTVGLFNEEVRQDVIDNWPA